MDYRLFDLTGRRALITGSSQGIGLALAHGLAAAGAQIRFGSGVAAAQEIYAEPVARAGQRSARSASRIAAE